MSDPRDIKESESPIITRTSSTTKGQGQGRPPREEKEPDVIVIDVGTGSIKAGWAGEDAPRCCIPTILLDHHSSSLPASIDTDTTEFAIGADAWHLLGMSTKQHNGRVIQPIERGTVVDWDGLTKIWEHIFKKELRCNPKDHPVLLTLPPLAPPTARTEMAKIMFDHFAVPSLAIANQAVLALYSTGRTTGVVLELGEGMSSAIPIYEGFALNHAILRLSLAGRDLTRYLSRILGERGCTFHEYQADTVRDIKEKLCRVRSHRDATAAEVPSDTPSDIDTYELPDGTIIRIDDHCRYSPPECLFDPRMLGMDVMGVHKMVWESVLKCDTHLRKELLKNIVVAGGTSMTKGFGDRMKREISALYHADPQSQIDPNSKDPPVQIITDSQRKYGTWIGGSMYASLPTFSTIKITETEYKRDETIVHKKYV